MVLTINDRKYVLDLMENGIGLEIELIYKKKNNTLAEDYYLIIATDTDTKNKMYQAINKYNANNNNYTAITEEENKIFNDILNDYFDKVTYLEKDKEYYYNAYDVKNNDNFKLPPKGLQLPLIYLGKYDGKNFARIFDDNSLNLDSNVIIDNLNKVYVAKDFLADQLKIKSGGKRKSRRHFKRKTTKIHKKTKKMRRTRHRKRVNIRNSKK